MAAGTILDHGHVRRPEGRVCMSLRATGRQPQAVCSAICRMPVVASASARVLRRFRQTAALKRVGAHKSFEVYVGVSTLRARAAGPSPGGSTRSPAPVSRGREAGSTWLAWH